MDCSSEGVGIFIFSQSFGIIVSIAELILKISKKWGWCLFVKAKYRIKDTPISESVGGRSKRTNCKFKASGHVEKTFGSLKNTHSKEYKVAPVTIIKHGYNTFADCH